MFATDGPDPDANLLDPWKNQIAFELDGALCWQYYLRSLIIESSSETWTDNVRYSIPKMASSL